MLQLFELAPVLLEKSLVFLKLLLELSQPVVVSLLRRFLHCLQLPNYVPFGFSLLLLELLMIVMSWLLAVLELFSL